MGFSLAEEAVKRGAKSDFNFWSTSQKKAIKILEIHRVTSAKEMYDEVFKYYEKVDICYYKCCCCRLCPKNRCQRKNKKSEEEFTIELVKIQIF